MPAHRERLLRAARGMCASREEAEDLVQETFARVLDKPRFLRGDDDAGYLLRVLRNTWINDLRRRRREFAPAAFDEALSVSDHGSDPFVSVSTVDLLQDAVSRLSPVLRETLLAVDVLGLSYDQTASVLGTRIGTVMSRLHRARHAAASALQDE